MAPRANWKGVQRSQAKGPVCVIHRDAHTSAIGPGVAICTIGLKGPVLENRVFAAIEQVEKELRAIDGRLADLEMKKQRVIDVDLSGDLSRKHPA